MRALCSLNFSCKSDSAIFYDTDCHVLLKKKSLMRDQYYQVWPVYKKNLHIISICCLTSYNVWFTIEGYELYHIFSGHGKSYTIQK